VLTVAGCPNRDAAIALVHRVCAELGSNAEIRLIDIPDQLAAEQARFLGSPTIRVDGRDVEPDADRCVEYICSCRSRLLLGFLEAEVLPQAMRAVELGIDPTPLLDVVATVLRMYADGLERPGHGAD